MKWTVVIESSQRLIWKGNEQKDWFIIDEIVQSVKYDVHASGGSGGGGGDSRRPSP